MNKLAYITFFYVIIIIFQIAYTIYNTKYRNRRTVVDDRIKFNQDNYEELTLYLKKKLEERIDLLLSHKLNVDDWIEYNKNNVFVEFKGQKYYFFIYESGGDKETLVNYLHGNPDYYGLDWHDIIKVINEEFVFLKQSPNEFTAKNLLEIGRKDIAKMRYYWPDPVSETPIQKESYVYTIPESDDHGDLLIGIGFGIRNLDEQNRLYYIDYVYNSYIIAISLITYIISILIIIFVNDKTFYKPFIFLLFTNIYLLYFLNTSEYHGKVENEIKKIDHINSGTLSVSFLVGVNTFIITALTKYDRELFIQSASVFAISVILLLIASLKITDTITIYELIRARISNQLIFNFSILLNAFVVINYIVSVIRHNYKILIKGLVR